MTTDTPAPLTWLPPADERWRATVADFAAGSIGPRVRSMDETGQVDPDLLRELFKAGLMGIEIPAAYGGVGGDLFQVVLGIAEVARVDPSVAVLVDVQNALVASALLRHGSGDQRRRQLPRLATRTVAAYAISEAAAGSDAFAMETTAYPDGPGYRLSGTKCWTSSAREAGLFLVFAKLHGQGLTAFLVERELTGVEVGEPITKLGLRASATCEVRLTDVKVKRADVVGGVGGGEVLAAETLAIGKLGIAAQQVGLADGALAAAVGYAGARHQFGQPIGDFQGVSFPLARIAAELAAARTLLYNTARLIQRGGAPAERLREAAMAKYFAAEVAERAASQSVETLGGNGYVSDYPVAKFYRDAKAGKIYEGTSNMQFRTIYSTLEFQRPSQPSDQAAE
ncbi:acyl-CoA dehydrogenase family protein [Natronosporangium hydrolyticum]|uniref:short-chain 2-methylacyl-CoA dehydrogenase n=1 Tax=Natronosporangium hydrolyticum TaxID=2811111 RepID=A0A895Y9J0_9ACTN|nr:acyl-CoA dehydrogenase family protein [Natronosporangium hydrolyticum]QSB13991.1 acyl-CoA dehydrogenase family protein [Natronosporangium hydrolyticum]